MSSLAGMSAQERQPYLREAAARLGLSPIVVEKDFWVCWLLGRVFSHVKFRHELVFKGGTSLSKVYRAIHRFSEDIDLSISPGSLGAPEAGLESEASRAARARDFENLQRACSSYVRDTLRTDLELDLQAHLGSPTPDRNWLRFEVDAKSHSPVLWFDYPSSLPAGDLSYIQPAVKLELGSLTDQRPRSWQRIQSLVGEELAELAEPMPEVLALEIERTFWEKATLLHAEYHRPANRPLAPRLARHYSDMAELWRHDCRDRALALPELLDRVARHKARFFPSSWARYEEARPGSLRLVPPEARQRDLESDFRSMAPMFFLTPRPFAEVLAVLAEAERTINGG